MDLRIECSRPRPDQLKAKARQPRGQGQDHRILSSSSRLVLEDTIPGHWIMGHSLDPLPALIWIMDIKTYPFDIVGTVDLLVLRVSSIIARTNWKQHDVFASDFLQGQRDWNTATFTDQIGLFTKHYRDMFETHSMTSLLTVDKLGKLC